MKIFQKDSYIIHPLDIIVVLYFFKDPLMTNLTETEMKGNYLKNT